MGKQRRLTAAERANFVLRLLGGEALDEVAKEAGVLPRTVEDWRDVFTDGGKSALRTSRTHKRRPEGQVGLPGMYPAFLEALRPALEETYAYGCELGRGKNGVTCKLQNRLTGSFYCLKTLDPTTADKATLESARDKLEKEVKILAPIRHRCLPRIYERDLDHDLPYYVETFHPGTTFSVFRKEGKRLRKEESAFVILSLIDALRTIHEMGRSHCDLHEDNIMISDRVFAHGILVIDFGSGHRQSESSPETPDGGLPQFKGTPALGSHHYPRERAAAQTDFEASDYRALGDLLSAMADCFFGDAPHDQRVAYLEFCHSLRHGDTRSWDAALTRFSSVTDTAYLINQADRLFVHRDGTRPSIPLPVSDAVPVGEATLAVINCSVFQRLRFIKQLSFCEWFFPGGIHTRFEHSLGVLGIARHALSFLVRDRTFRNQFVERNIDGALLAALVHDVGHYPYAHVLEHYVASRHPDDRDLLADVHHAKHTHHLLATDGELRRAVERNWGQGCLEEALRILQGSVPVLRDLLDGPIDVDKLDYVRRDAHHCGITFGRGLDVNRIVESLTCVKGAEELGITQEGVFAVEGFVVAQEQMLGSVYWHECIRSVMAMFQEFIRAITNGARDSLRSLAQKLKAAASELQALKEVLLPMTSQLSEALQRRLAPLFSLHERPQFKDIYQAVAKYTHLDRVPPRVASRLTIYQSIVRRPTSSVSVIPIDWGAAEQLRACFIGAFRQKPALSKVGRYDVLVDVAWGKAGNRLLTVRANGDGRECPITEVSHLRESIFTEPTAFLAPVRVFVCPHVYEKAASHIDSIRTAAEEMFYSNQSPEIESVDAVDEVGDTESATSASA